MSTEKPNGETQSQNPVESSDLLARMDILQLWPVTLEETVIRRQVNNGVAKGSPLGEHNPSSPWCAHPNVFDAPNMSQWHDCAASVIANLDRITCDPNPL